MQYRASQGRRDSADAIPRNLSQLLSSEQRFMLHRMESAGWTLEFVRRRMDQSPVVVLHNPARNCYCTLERNGAAVRDPTIAMRKASR